MTELKHEMTSLPGVFLIKPYIFEDFRGQYVETYNQKLYDEAFTVCLNDTRFESSINFVQDDISVSSKNVLRGIHGDDKTYKLVSCLYGKFYLVIVNFDKKSDNYHKWESFTLSSENRHQVLIPPKHGNGHLVLTDMAIFHYKQSAYYDRSSQFTYKWNDPELNIWWPTKNPILSQRDDA